MKFEPMPDSIAALPRTIQALLEKRHAHVQAMEGIDATLARVNAALSDTSATAPPPMAPPGSKATITKKIGTPRGKATGQTAAEFVLAFVKAKKNPTSSEINTAWKAAGRNWTADITLSLLTKAKKLKRTPLGAGIRGSRYSIAA